MNIAMLGWEFPPFISGGLGTACYGLTKALDARGHEVLFVLPRPVDRSKASHIRLLSPDAPPPAPDAQVQVGLAERLGNLGDGAALAAEILAEERAAALQSGLAHPVTGPFKRMRLVGVPAGFSSVYGDGGVVGTAGRRLLPTGSKNPDGTAIMLEVIDDDADELLSEAEALEGWWQQGDAMGDLGKEAANTPHIFGQGGPGIHYRGNLIAESERYARLVVALTRGQKIDVIHAHDWLTFPAGIALARAVNKPLVVHIHSTEFDRSGDNVNQRVYDLERRGMMAAVRVICVSELTRNICITRYGVPASKIDVVYNGIENEALQPHPEDGIKKTDKVVLFLGRITMQKGPEYFIAAAKLVLEKVPEAKFIIAGSGDMEARMIELAAEMHIGHRVLFTGFLRGKDVDRVYKMADCYVMPSVSEPFGIAPLEAMRHDVPTIISKQSGVSEVLTHVLKVDFWDVPEMANKIVAVLRYPPLSQTLREHGSVEVKRLTWDTSAEACEESYASAVKDHSGVGGFVPGSGR